MKIDTKYKIIKDYIKTIMELSKVNKRIIGIDKLYLVNRIYNDEPCHELELEGNLMLIRQKRLNEELGSYKKSVSSIINTKNNDVRILYNYIKGILRDMIFKDDLYGFYRKELLLNSSVIENLFYQDLKVTSWKMGERPVIKDDITFKCSKKTGIIAVRNDFNYAFLNEYQYDPSPYSLEEFCNLVIKKDTNNELYDFTDPMPLIRIVQEMKNHNRYDIELFDHIETAEQTRLNVNKFFKSKEFYILGRMHNRNLHKYI